MGNIEEIKTVEFKKDPSTDYHKCVDIFNRHFYVIQDEYGVDLLYKINSKNKILQFIFYLFDFNNVGWFEYHHDNSVDIWGDKDLVIDAANELESLGFKVTIYS